MTADELTRNAIARIALTGDGRILHIFLQRKLMELCSSPGVAGALPLSEGERRFASELKALMDSALSETSSDGRAEPSTERPIVVARPAASASPAPSAPAAASPSTPSNPPAGPAPKVCRHLLGCDRECAEGRPEALVKDLRERDELKAFKATEDSKRLTLPQKPDDYKIELPADFKPPEGVTFEFKADDPLMAQARTFAHQAGISQEGFSKLLSLHAASQVESAASCRPRRPRRSASSASMVRPG
jgi:hypothetical protein